MPTKDKVPRDTRKRFTVYVTTLAGVAQDPDTCSVRLVKQGTNRGDSPKGPYTCSLVGDVGSGEFAADVNLSESMTLGDWVALFTWTIGNHPSVIDGQPYLFTVTDLVTPYTS